MGGFKHNLWAGRWVDAAANPADSQCDVSLEMIQGHHLLFLYPVSLSRVASQFVLVLWLLL